MAIAEKDASKSVENERVKKAVIIPPTGMSYVHCNYFSASHSFEFLRSASESQIYVTTLPFKSD